MTTLHQMYLQIHSQTVLVVIFRIRTVTEAALIANPSIATSQALQPETPSPSPSSPFTVTGTGTGSNASFVCDPPVDPSLTFSIDFSAQRDGTVSGTYTILASNGNSQPSGLTDGSTDGNTFTLSGINEVCMC